MAIPETSRSHMVYQDLSRDRHVPAPEAESDEPEEFDETELLWHLLASAIPGTLIALLLAIALVAAMLFFG